MGQDYKSFSGVANTRFKGMAKRLNFVEGSKNWWSKLSNDIYHTYFLNKSHGNNFFYVDYGIGIPYLMSHQKTLDHTLINGVLLDNRLLNDGRSGFKCDTKKDIEESAERTEVFFKDQALPWFSQFQSLEDVAKLILSDTVIENGPIETKRNYTSLNAMQYAFFYYHLENYEMSKEWFLEAHRMLSLPKYFLKEGNVQKLVHERPKGAREYKPDEFTIENLKKVEEMLDALGKNSRS